MMRKNRKNMDMPNSQEIVLPNEIYTAIFNFLPAKDLIKTRFIAGFLKRNKHFY